MYNRVANTVVLKTTLCRGPKMNHKLTGGPHVDEYRPLHLMFSRVKYGDPRYIKVISYITSPYDSLNLSFSRQVPNHQAMDTEPDLDMGGRRS
jgi:hypothetical protein